MEALDVTNMMILLKVMRARRAYREDSYVDIAGYAAIAEKVHQSDAVAETPADSGEAESYVATGTHHPAVLSEDAASSIQLCRRLGFN